MWNLIKINNAEEYSTIDENIGANTMNNGTKHDYIKLTAVNNAATDSSMSSREPHNLSPNDKATLKKYYVSY